MKVFRQILAIPVLLAMPLYAICDEQQPANLLLNPGFEELDENEKVAAWSFRKHTGEEAYKFNVDADTAFSGKQSYRIEQYADQVYGMVGQAVVLPEQKSERFSFSAMLKTEDIGEGRGWQLVVNCLGPGARIMKQYRSEPLNGTNDWQRVVLEEDIPRGTQKLSAGIILESMGTGWVDDAYIGVK